MTYCIFCDNVSCFQPDRSINSSSVLGCRVSAFTNVITFSLNMQFRIDSDTAMTLSRQFRIDIDDNKRKKLTFTEISI